jgi:hypothetical protein
MNKVMIALTCQVMVIVSFSISKATAGSTYVVDPATVKLVTLESDTPLYHAGTDCAIYAGGVNYGYLRQNECQKAQELVQQVPAKNLVISNFFLQSQPGYTAHVTQDTTSPLRENTISDLQKQVAQLQSRLHTCQGAQTAGETIKQVEDLSKPVVSTPVAVPVHLGN